MDYNKRKMEDGRREEVDKGSLLFVGAICR
jgi:hypothetical protein